MILLIFELRMIYVHLDFFLWLLLIPFIYVKERKIEKKVLEKNPKDELSSHVTGKKSVSKYRNRRTTRLL